MFIIKILSNQVPEASTALTSFMQKLVLNRDDVFEQATLIKNGT